MADERIMRCPYCDRMFWITEEEQYGNEVLTCPHCYLANAGCNEGMLIGVSILDFELQELLSQKEE